MNNLKHEFANWNSFLSRLPSNLEESAQEQGALIRKREVKSASDLLRLVFGYSILGFSLKDLSIWALQMDISKISATGLLKRFLNCGRWLRLLIGLMLCEKVGFKPSNRNHFRIRLFDGSTLNRPGSDGSDFRIHVGLDLKTLQVDHLELSNFKKGESLTNFSFNPGDLAVCDRGYSHRRGVQHVVDSGGEVVVRLCWSNFPMQNPDGTVFDLFTSLRSLRGKDFCDVSVKTAPIKEIPSISGRFIGVRKEKEAAERARRKANRDARKKGRTPSKLTLEACDYIFLFTTCSEAELGVEDVLEIYKFRWQIEFFFKRLKSIIDLDKIKAKHDKLCDTFILGKLLAMLIIEKILFLCGIFGSGQESLSRPVSLWRVVKSLYKTLQTAIGTIGNLEFWIQAFEEIVDRFKDSPRKRVSQSAQAMNFREKFKRPLKQPLNQHFVS